MIINPPVIALLVSSALVSLMIIYAAFHGVRILRGWNLQSGSEEQLSMERRTYLVSTMLAWAMAFQSVSLFLFIHTAEDLHPLFVGAMCAAGTLNVNTFGYPALILKSAVFVTAGMWLIINHVDNRAPDYPLIKIKYGLLLFIAPLSLAEAVTLWAYIMNLKADVITSCCGTLFSRQGGTGEGAYRFSISGIALRDIFYSIITFSIASGIYFLVRRKGGYLYSVLSALALPVSIAAVIYYISPYFYELPTHLCPFCLLQSDYHYIGYLLYVTIFAGGVFGIGVGALMPFRNIGTLTEIVPETARKLVLASVICYLLFVFVITWRILSTDFVLLS